MSFRPGWWALWLSACTPTMEPPPPPHPPTTAELPAPPDPDDASATPGLDSYGIAFVRGYSAAYRVGQHTNIYGPGEVEDIDHWVLQFEPERMPHLYLTVGFGRTDQRHAFGSTPPRVELLAMIAADQDADVVNVLSRLGGWLHAETRDVSQRFAAFQTLRVDEPIAGMRFFLLVPAGEVTLFDRDHITVLRVIPAAEEEYVHLKMRGDGAARAWWNRHKGDPATARRWSSAVPVPFVPD